MIFDVYCKKIDLLSTSQTQMVISTFNNSISKIRCVRCCSNIMLLHTYQDSVNNFYMYWETKKFMKMIPPLPASTELLLLP